jgi:hypothetical protein
MLKIGIIVGSTRPGRKASAVAKWVHDILKSRKDGELEIVDIEDYKLPLLDEPVQQVAHEDLEPENSLARRPHFRHPRIQSHHLGGSKERNQFSLPRRDNKAAGFVGCG